MLAEVEKDPTIMARIIKRALDDAEAGQKDAREFFAKYFLGNGKISLDELYSPPLIRPAGK